MSMTLTIQAVEDDGIFYMTVLASKPLWKGSGNRFVVDTYNHPFIFRQSSVVCDLVNAKVKANELGPADFVSGPISDALENLNLAIYAMRVKDTQYSLGQLITLAAGLTNEPIYFAVGRSLETVPWEITSPDHMNGNRLLGSFAFVSGNLVDVDQEETSREKVTKSARAPLIPFNRVVNIRAAGNEGLAGANDEEVFLLRPNKVARGLVAPPISGPGTEPGFFTHFNPDNYSVVHIFSHCDYEDPLGSGFRLHVTNSYPLGVSAFYRNNAIFQPRVLHFLNVCMGAPTEGNRNRSLVEYMARQQDAAAVVASLVLVRSIAAVDMAKAFYRYFLPPTSQDVGGTIAEAMYLARKELWDRGEAAGYLYRAYGNPKTRLKHYETQDDDGAAHVVNQR